MIYRIAHSTIYQYSDPVTFCQNLVHLTARQSPWQACKQSQLLVNPLPAVTASRLDYFGNPTTYFSIQEPHYRLSVTAINVAALTIPVTPLASSTPPWEVVRDMIRSARSDLRLEACQYVVDSPYVASSSALAEYARPSFPPRRPLLEGVLDLMQRIHREFRYDSRATTLATPLQEVLAGRRGVCQDFAHLQIGCLRSLGLPARYVSGYLLTTPPPGQPRLIGADASHAWLSVFCPEHGWIDIDPTNNVIPSDKHILLAWGRDYDDVSPMKGVILGGGSHTLTVSVDVIPVAEAMF